MTRVVPPRGAGRHAAARTAKGTVATLSLASTAQAGANTLAALWATRALGPAPRGVMVVALTIATTAALVAGAGAGSAYRSELARADERRRATLAASYGTIAVLGPLLAAALAVLASHASASLIDPGLAATPLLAAVGLATVAQAVAGLTTEAWFADGRFRPAGGWAALSALAGLLAMLAVAAVHPTPAALLAAQAGGNLAVTALAARALTGVGALARPGTGAVGRLLRRGWPALGFSVGLTVTLRADRYLLGVFAGPAAVTLYSLAATLAEIPRTIPQALGQLLSRRIAEGSRTAPDRTTIAAAASVIATGTALGVLAWYAIPVVFGPDLDPAKRYLIVLLAAELLFTPFTVAAKGLVGGGWTATVGMVGCLGSAVALGAFCALAPPFGIWGACAACCLTYAALSALAHGSLRRLLRREAAHR